MCDTIIWVFYSKLCDRIFCIQTHCFLFPLPQNMKPINSVHSGDFFKSTILRFSESVMLIWCRDVKERRSTATRNAIERSLPFLERYTKIVRKGKTMFLWTGREGQEARKTKLQVPPPYIISWDCICCSFWTKSRGWMHGILHSEKRMGENIILFLN